MNFMRNLLPMMEVKFYEILKQRGGSGGLAKTMDSHLEGSGFDPW
jgi:hypothetical protein